VLYRFLTLAAQASFQRSRQTQRLQGLDLKHTFDETDRVSLRYGGTREDGSEARYKAIPTR
jgi:hypothetical protein